MLMDYVYLEFLASKRSVIVAGGENGHGVLSSVEILDQGIEPTVT